MEASVAASLFSLSSLRSPKEKRLILSPFPLLSKALATMSPQLIETTESDTRVVVARFVAALAAGKVRNRERFDGGGLFSSMPPVVVVVKLFLPAILSLSPRADPLIPACIGIA